MKCLFISIQEWESTVTHLATRGNNIITDPMREEILIVKNSCAILITYEKNDLTKDKNVLFIQIKQEVLNLGRNNALIVPFGHLSSDLGDASEARNFLEELKQYLISNNIVTIREHFGSDKEIKLLLKSHPGSVRFREF